MIKGGDIDTGDGGQPAQQLFPAFAPGPAVGVEELQEHLLAVADDKSVDEVGHRLRVEAAGATGDDEGVGTISLRGQHRNPRQVEHVEHVGVGKLVPQRETDDIEVLERPLVFQAEEGDAALAQGGLQVCPGGVHPLGEDVRLAVEQVVEDGHGHVGHAYLVGIRVGQCYPDGGPFPVLDDAVPLAAGIAGGAVDPVKYFAIEQFLPPDFQL